MTKRLLTKRKAKWVAQRKPEMLRGAPLNFSASNAGRYSVQLERLVQIMAREVERALKQFFETQHAQEFFAQDASTASQARILMNALIKKFNDMFAVNAKLEAERMAARGAKSSSTAVHSSIQELSGGLSLSTRSLTEGDTADILTATIAENVGLIKSISQQYLDGVQGAVMRSITTGNGLQDLVPFLAQHKGVTLRRARMISHDQTRKLFNNLNREKLQNLGMKKFEWLHTSGSREPRELHISYSGKIFSFDDPPIIDKNTGERGIPGQAINCRCRIIPVIDFGED